MTGLSPEATTAAPELAADLPANAAPKPASQGMAALMLGAVGVVFGDIGTSPLYAMRVALGHARHGASHEMAVLGVISLVIWALILVVTVKYVIFLMRADNRGEGGTLALSALAQHAAGRRTAAIFVISVAGAALFFGDCLITPAISVLSAVEGVKGAPQIGHLLNPYVESIAAGILVALFLVQSRGTHRVAALFGPIVALWFLALAGLGLYHLGDDISILRAISPYYGVSFLLSSGYKGFLILGAVFLVATGASALYADMGHFGRRPIRAAWLWFVLPCLALNYLGQGAMMLRHPQAHDPFWSMAPDYAYWPVLGLATAATVIASQAVITGAFSMTQQAVQLGLLPRMNIRRTSETQAGQIFIPSVNLFLTIGVMLLLFVFQTSAHLASAYGAAVTGAMFVDTLLAWVIVRKVWNWRLWQAAALVVPIGVIDLVFISSNLVKLVEGAWVPVALGLGLMLVMWTWSRGSHILSEKTRRDSLPLCDLIDMLKARPPYRSPGTAMYLTADADMAPVALMHNLKHNKVLHQMNVIVTVRTADIPEVPECDRIAIEKISDDFKKLTLTYGFMESPNLPKALQICRKQGLKFDIMTTSFFLGRRSLVRAEHSGMPVWQDKLFIFLTKNSANPTDFFKIPPGRVVELGAQVTV
ncbi:potassium transporter Kup [Phenylobacterium montanum]|uniref:Probable potassium transport system protein Kup n=1 Tax=Phenylobacterium montanum TaxID=2823693 RepID=A0A975FW16_9CAUL|nr:potassium transporter Kup [Caulobacter sp. S6]QUD86518.1 potassium transporter Kup [Caulobacter sp. S6]